MTRARRLRQCESRIATCRHCTPPREKADYSEAYTLDRAGVCRLSQLGYERNLCREVDCKFNTFEEGRAILTADAASRGTRIGANASRSTVPQRRGMSWVHSAGASRSFARDPTVMRRRRQTIRWSVSQAGENQRVLAVVEGTFVVSSTIRLSRASTCGSISANIRSSGSHRTKFASRCQRPCSDHLPVIQ